MLILSKDSPVPLYFQIKSELERFIASGKWQPGMQAPSERELCDQYQVSRITVRQAITELVNEGRLVREQGRGTFVAQPRIEQQLTTLTSFTQDMLQRGQKPGSRVLQFGAEELPPQAAQALGLDPSAKHEALILKRLRTANDEPLTVETARLALPRCAALAGVNLERQSLYAALREKCGVLPTLARQQIKAMACPDAEAKILEIKKGSPVLHIIRSTFGQDNKAFEYVESVYRGDKYVFYAELHMETTRGHDAPLRHARARSNGMGTMPVSS